MRSPDQPRIWLPVLRAGGETTEYRDREVLRELQDERRHPRRRAARDAATAARCRAVNRQRRDQRRADDAQQCLRRACLPEGADRQNTLTLVPRYEFRARIGKECFQIGKAGLAFARKYKNGSLNPSRRR